MCGRICATESRFSGDFRENDRVISAFFPVPFKYPDNLGFVYAQIAIANVPQTRRKRPTSAFFDSFSLNTKYEKPIDIRILNLSIGTTTLTMPFCIA